MLIGSYNTCVTRFDQHANIISPERYVVLELSLFG
jgi:hypothetical protein